MSRNPDRVEPRADTVLGNLPHQLTSFVGRTQEVCDIDRALSGTRLLTLTGVGGCGKTRIALKVATEARSRYPGGTWWVELGALREREQVEAALAASLGVRALADQTALRAAELVLADRCALVIFDNCEHLLEASGGVIERLLCACPSVTVLVTSRAALGVAGEVRWRVPSLLPSDGRRLFCERARNVQPGFEVTPDNASAIEAICRAVEGIALAIELAAARLGMMSVQEVAEALSDCLRLLTGSPRGALPHQQTLRASVEWSHELLGDAERALLRRLAVFDGGWTLQLAEQVASGESLERLEILDLMGSLVDKSLVVVEQRGPATRFRLLEVVRQYALERLAEAGEEQAARKRHCNALLALAERAEPHLTGETQRAWLAALAAEHSNLTQALGHACASDPEKALRLVAALTFHYRRSGRFAAGDKGFALALEAAPASAPGRARALWGRAFLSAHAGNWEPAISSAQQALSLAEEAADSSTMGRALAVIGFVLQFPDPVGARTHLERSCALGRESADPWCEVFSTQSLAWTYHVQDRADEARALADETRPLVERQGYGEFLAKYHLLVGLRAFAQADWRAFEDSCERGLAAAHAVDEPLLEGSLEVFRGWSQILRGRTDDAVARGMEARERAVRAGAGLILPGIEYLLGWADLVHGRAGEALNRMEAIVATGIDGGPYLARALLLRGEAQRELGHLEAASGSWSQALEIATRIQSAWIVAEVHLSQARACIDTSQWVAATDPVHRALAKIEQRGLVVPIPGALETLAAAAVGLSSEAKSSAVRKARSIEGARLLGAARRARAEHELAPLMQAERIAALEQALVEQLSASELDDAMAEGGRLPPLEAVAWMRRGRRRGHGQPNRPTTGWQCLTPTERAVALHVVAGLTNPQIAEEMFVTRGTIKTHLAHIYSKLNLKNRSELAAAVARHQASF